jgi:hypothetical protein
MRCAALWFFTDPEFVQPVGDGDYTRRLAASEVKSPHQRRYQTINDTLRLTTDTEGFANMCGVLALPCMTARIRFSCLDYRRVPGQLRKHRT